ncbi:hypothetical protein PR202_gb25059 [Eleusine coracana subsp. coracana]|uniref:Tetraspanin-3 n=1 Tax=Eleusine coracana subsp. coracana TaxID=191504 RepID=A0AAV5FKD0_ELECO|nr:hypothetical protein PR202_gb25059 [Eleusine coracana subsp. coracana]
MLRGRGSTSVLGIINFITFLISIPILGGGIWLASRANSTDCIRFLQWPIIVVGLALMVISLMGFAGACYRQTWLLRLYLFAMFFVVLALLFFIVFAFAVTDRGDGQVVMNRRFLEYQLSDWRCLLSGCCKPPSACAFTYMNETYWTPNPGVPLTLADCAKWSNDQQMLCFQCDSCKAGVLAGIKKSWRKVAILNIVVLIILVIVYVAGCAAFRNAKRIENDEPIGMARMTKTRPSRFQL